jgi:hypothetical protein
MPSKQQQQQQLSASSRNMSIGFCWLLILHGLEKCMHQSDTYLKSYPPHAWQRICRLHCFDATCMRLLAAIQQNNELHDGQYNHAKLPHHTCPTARAEEPSTLAISP